MDSLKFDQFCTFDSTRYKILEEGPIFFHELYRDMSFTFLDACFSPESNGLAVILTKYPSLVSTIITKGSWITTEYLEPRQQTYGGTEYFSDTCAYIY